MKERKPLPRRETDCSEVTLVAMQRGRVHIRANRAKSCC